MKNRSYVVLNLKDEYSRCMIPDVTLGDRGWKVDGPQRETARFEGEPRMRVRVFDKTDDRSGKRTREPIITFNLKHYQSCIS